MEKKKSDETQKYLSDIFPEGGSRRPEVGGGEDVVY
jgi:hypothetical protein